MAKPVKAAPKKTAKKTSAKPAAKASAKAVAKPAAKPAPKTVKAKTAKKVAAPAKAAAKNASSKSGEALLVENIATLTALVASISETMDVLVQKAENMAYHLIATEEVLAEVVASTGVDLVSINTRIRAKIAKGTERKVDPTRAIDIAASIASPRAKN